jgi:hypothetical protein
LAGAVPPVIGLIMVADQVGGDGATDQILGGDAARRKIQSPSARMRR